MAYLSGTLISTGLPQQHGSVIRVFEHRLLLLTIAEDGTRAMDESLASLQAFVVWAGDTFIRCFLRKEDAEGYASQLTQSWLSHKATRARATHFVDPPVDVPAKDRWLPQKIYSQELEVEPATNDRFILDGLVIDLGLGLALAGDELGPFTSANEAIQGARRLQQRIDLDRLAPYEEDVANPAIVSAAKGLHL